MALASAAELSFNWLGFLSAMMSNITFGFRAVWSKQCAPVSVRPLWLVPGFGRRELRLVVVKHHVIPHAGCIRGAASEAPGQHSPVRLRHAHQGPKLRAHSRPNQPPSQRNETQV